MLGERIKFLSLTAVETLHLRLPAQRVLLGIVGCCRSLLASQAMFKGFEFNSGLAIVASLSQTIRFLNGLNPSGRSEEHTSELQSLMRISYAVFCLNKKNKNLLNKHTNDSKCIPAIHQQIQHYAPINNK